MKSLARFAILLAGLPMAGAHASDFDGSKRLICAPVIAMDCLSDGKCSRELPAEIGAPAFMRIDFARKVQTDGPLIYRTATKWPGPG